MTREELLSRCGNISQVRGVTPFIYDDGKGRGVHAYRVRTGTGLDFTVLRDRALDVFECSYKGVNISFITRNGLVSPAIAGDDFDRSMCGGLFFTGGIYNTGRPFGDYPWHGRIHRYPASLSYARDLGDVIEIGGDVTDSTLECALCLHRKIEACGNEIIISDTIENMEAKPQDFALLYHLNMGFPFIDEKAELKIEKPYDVYPFFEFDKETVDTHRQFDVPRDLPERNYLLDVPADEDGFATVMVESPTNGICVYIRARKDTLPYFNQWKSVTPGLYTMAVEPSNNRLMGIERETEMKRLEPFSSADHKVIFGIKEM